MQTYFNGKTIWITGASSGIGAALAIELSKFGTTLILSARRLKQLDLVRQQCADPNKVHIEVMDMQEVDKIDHIFKNVMKVVGKIDMLINNAGVSQRSLVVDTLFETEQKIMQINYFSVIKLSKLCLEQFIKQNSGHFVIMSSTTGKVGIPLRSSYAASKHALHGYFEALRAELANHNIFISILCPASINTEISKNALVGDGQRNELMDDAQKNGMSLETFTRKALNAISQKKAEVSIGTFRESKLVLFIWRFAPNIFRRLIRKAKVT